MILTEVERPTHTPVGNAIPWLGSWAVEVEKAAGTWYAFLSLCHNYGSGMIKCYKAPTVSSSLLQWIEPLNCRLNKTPSPLSWFPGYVVIATETNYRPEQNASIKHL